MALATPHRQTRPFAVAPGQPSASARDVEQYRAQSLQFHLVPEHEQTLDAQLIGSLGTVDALLCSWGYRMRTDRGIPSYARLRNATPEAFTETEFDPDVDEVMRLMRTYAPGEYRILHRVFVDRQPLNQLAQQMNVPYSSLHRHYKKARLWVRHRVRLTATRD